MAPIAKGLEPNIGLAGKGVEPNIGLAGKIKSNKQTVPPKPIRQKVPSFWNTPLDVPPTKMIIHHEFDPLLHFYHKVNITIRNINAVIRLIFKKTKDQAAITAVSPGSTMHHV